MFRASDLCAHPFSRAIRYLGDSFGGFLCNQISKTFVSCASETARGGNGSPQWNRHDLSTFILPQNVLHRHQQRTLDLRLLLLGSHASLFPQLRLFEGSFPVSLFMTDLSFSFLSNSRFLFFLACASAILRSASGFWMSFLD